MAAGTKFYSFVEALAEGAHNLGTDTLKVCLSNTAPDPAADTVFSDIVEIAAGFGYTAGGTTAVLDSSGQAGGVYTLVLDDVAFTAAGGPMATFRYAVLYNDTAALNELIGYWDNGSGVTLADTEVFTLDFSAVNGALTIT